jgi:Glycosyltransferase family 87
LALVGYAALAGIVAWWTWRALHDPRGFDFRLYYKGGQVAWATGHPEHQSTWDGTPLLAAAMALLTRLMSLGTGADLITAVNLVLVVAAVAVVLRRLWGQISPVWWWVTAFALLSFGPTMSTVWWKQFNIIALALALGGFELLRRRRTQSAAALIGLSISIKPLIFLLPLILLARRETRRVGAFALGWVVALNMAGQALLSARAHDLGAISPIPALQNFIDKAKPGNVWACQSVNFAPGSLLCRLVGHQNWTLQHVVVWAVVALLGAGVIAALRGRGASSWELFAFTCALSVMLSPLAWAHYQIVLAPLFVLLLVRFTREGAGVLAWTGLASAFVLASLMWLPYGTLHGAISGLVSMHGQTRAQTVHDEHSVASFAQFAQYVLVVTGLLWYAGPRARGRPLAFNPTT